VTSGCLLLNIATSPRPLIWVAGFQGFPTHIHLPSPPWTSVQLQALSLSFPPPYTSSGLLIPESILSILTLERDSSFVTRMLCRLWSSLMLLRLSLLLLPGIFGVSRRRVFSYRRRRTAMRGTERIRHTIAMTIPMMAPGLKPSLRETAFGTMAGGASGMPEVLGVGAIVYVFVLFFQSVERRKQLLC
jgi:hypothetical protein